MKSMLLDLLNTFPHATPLQADRALRQVLQQVALLGLWRAKFFEHAAFYGGTALRILYGLDRFSEDLDFSLLLKAPDFNLAPYLDAIEEELLSFGVHVQAYVFTRDSAFHGERRLQESQLKGGAHSNGYGRRLQAGRLVTSDPREGAIPVNMYAQVKEKQKNHQSAIQGLSSIRSSFLSEGRLVLRAISEPQDRATAPCPRRRKSAGGRYAPEKWGF